MPVTFGSVGDIIAVCILVKDCVDALSETKGAAASYQAVIRELFILEKALLEFDVLSRTNTTTAEVVALFDSARTTVEGCRKSLEAFKSKTKRYESHLGATTARTTTQKIFSDSAMKVLWQISIKDDVARFRAEVVAYSLSINQLLITATMHVMNANHDKLEASIQESRRQTEVSSTKRDKTLKEIRYRLKEVDRRISEGNNIANKFAKHARLEWLKQLGQELKSMMSNIITVNLATYYAILEVKGALPPTNQIFHSPASGPVFYFEDAIGRVTPITLEFITCWDAFHAVLEVRFQGIQGTKKVMKKEYALQNRATGKDIGFSQKWEMVFLPGQWVLMSMIFQDTNAQDLGDVGGDTCPKCQAKSNQPPGIDVKCLSCNLEYRRIVDITEDTIPKDNNAIHVHAPNAPDSAAVSAPNANRPLSPSQPREHKQEEDTNEDPANFNRVRIKMRMRRKLSLKATGGHESPENRKREDKVETDSVSDLPRVQAESLVKAKEGEPMTEKAATKKLSRKRSTLRATKEDARRAGIPAGYSYQNWDPREEPILLLGSVFDANSLGKWIYKWTVYHYGHATPLAELANELWILLVQLASKIMRAEEGMSRISDLSNRDIVEDFLESGERLWIRFGKLLKVCEDFMLKGAKERNGDKQPLVMGNTSGRDFVDAIFGRDRELEKTEKLLTGMRLWSMRFDANCGDILQHSSQ